MGFLKNLNKHCWCVTADRIEWNHKQNVQFVHNLVNTILQCMLYKNRIVEGYSSSQTGIIIYHQSAM